MDKPVTIELGDDSALLVIKLMKGDMLHFEVTNFTAETHADAWQTFFERLRTNSRLRDAIRAVNKAGLKFYIGPMRCPPEASTTWISVYWKMPDNKIIEYLLGTKSGQTED